MKSTTVRGTPYHHVSNTAREGIAPGTPSGYKGTGNPNLDAPGIRTGPQGPGTPYHSQAGNGPETLRVVSHDAYGHVESNAQGDANDPHNNGPSVMLNVGSQDAGYQAPHEPLFDSPVPGDAPRFGPEFIAKEDRAHLGTGIDHLAGKNNDLRLLDGVMSRGMDSVSRTSEPEAELTRDDVFRGTGGEAGSMRDVQGRSGKPIRE